MLDINKKGKKEFLSVITILIVSIIFMIVGSSSVFSAVADCTPEGLGGIGICNLNEYTVYDSPYGGLVLLNTEVNDDNLSFFPVDDIHYALIAEPCNSGCVNEDFGCAVAMGSALCWNSSAYTPGSPCELENSIYGGSAMVAGVINADGICGCNDIDGDGYGDPGATFCPNPAPFSDCDPADPNVWEELIGYLDLDGDGYGNAAISVPFCTNGTIPDEAFVRSNEDCDDDDDSLWQLIVGYQDTDGDGYGVNTYAEECTDGIVPSNIAFNTNDCNDADYTIRPGAVEICDDGVNNDCDGSTDENPGCSYVSIECAGGVYGGISGNIIGNDISTRADCVVESSQTVIIPGGSNGPPKVIFFVNDLTINAGVTLSFRTDSDIGAYPDAPGGDGHHWAGHGGDGGGGGRNTFDSHWDGDVDNLPFYGYSFAGEGGRPGTECSGGGEHCSKSSGGGSGGTFGKGGAYAIIDATGTVNIDGEISVSGFSGGNATNGGYQDEGWVGPLIGGGYEDCSSHSGDGDCGNGGGGGGGGGAGGVIVIQANTLTGFGKITADAGNGGNGGKGGDDHSDGQWQDGEHGAGGGAGGGADGGVIIIDAQITSNNFAYPMKGYVTGRGFAGDRGMNGGKSWGPGANDAEPGEYNRHGEPGEIYIEYPVCESCGITTYACTAPPNCLVSEGTLIGPGGTSRGSPNICPSCSSTSFAPCTCPAGCFLSEGSLRTSDLYSCGVGTFENSYTYSYDVLDRLTSVEFPDAPHFTVPYTVDYTYNSLGKRISEDHPDRGTTTFTYDALGRMTSRTNVLLNTQTYTYDSLGRMLNIYMS